MQFFCLEVHISVHGVSFFFGVVGAPYILSISEKIPIFNTDQ